MLPLKIGVLLEAELILTDTRISALIHCAEPYVPPANGPYTLPVLSKETLACPALKESVVRCLPVCTLIPRTLAVTSRHPLFK
jgi:hypothetical protein